MDPVLSLDNTAIKYGVAKQISILNEDHQDYMQFVDPFTKSWIGFPIQTGRIKAPADVNGLEIEDILFAAYLKTYHIADSEYRADIKEEVLKHIGAALDVLKTKRQ